MASSSSSSPIGQKPEVFLSFRGEDTRYNFTSHLHKALIGESIDTFIDDNLERGEEISSALLKTIEESMISIVILSKNYASSSWCLDELSKIIECKKTNGQIVVPIFYHVDPADVRKQTGKFGDKFAKCEERFRDMTDKVERWRAALTEVGSVSGWHLQNDRPEPKLLGDIVEDIMKKLPHTSSIDFDGLIGIHSHIEQIEQLLCIGSESACLAVGIWGMGGIGKTTIARAIFDKIFSQFNGYCFLDNVREASEKKGVVFLKKKLVGEILRDKDIKRGGTITKSIVDRLRRTKALIVLDDVDDSSQLESIIGRFDRFGKGSRIIITTRDKQVLNDGIELHEVGKLNNREALRLLEALKQDRHIEDFMELSKMVINYAQGIPLALKVLGSYLFSREKQEWKNALDRLKETPHPKIQDVLRISYVGLLPQEQDIFCDIACFFKGWNKDRVMKILDGCGLFPYIGIDVLVKKSLITISNDILDMHDLLHEMGLQIVREESSEPNKRSRLWKHKDVYDVLTNVTGTDVVKGILLDSFSSSKPNEASLRSTAFQGMHNLRYLILLFDHRLHFHDGLTYLSNELIYLRWLEYPLESLPQNFHPENLVELDMSYSKVKYLWEGTRPLPLPKLKVITLYFCKDLIKIPDLSEAPNLEHMNLSDCASLLEVHSSIQCLSKLMVLGLGGCKKLTSLPSTIYLTSLVKLFLGNCSNLKVLPDSVDNLSSLAELYLGNCSNLKELPDSLGHLLSLEQLHLKNCSNLKELPNSLDNLSSLEVLDLKNCSSLKELPDSLGNLSSLGELYLEGCSNLKELSDSLGNLSSLGVLDLEGCSNLKELPDSLGNLSSLGVLNLKNCSNLKELPNSLGNLSSLEVLDLENCSNLKELPDSLGNLSSLGELHLQDCSNLKELPDSLGNLSSLRSLSLLGNNIVSIPASIKHLSQLTSLDLRNCKRLQSLPRLPSCLKKIWANNCISLQTISFSSSTSSIRVTGIEQDLSISMEFIYRNCLKLDQNSRSNIEADAQLKILLLATTILKKNNCNSFKLVCPGSEIPGWFTYRSTGCRLPEKLHLDLGNSKFLGFALCVIAIPKGNSFGVCCEMETLNGKFSCGYYDFTSSSSESEHMFLWNVSCLDLRNELGDDWHRNNETSFKFFPYGETVVKKCGVHPLYECNLSMIQSRSPNENFGDVDQGLLEPMAEEGSNDHNICCDEDELNGTEEQPHRKKLKFYKFI